MLLPILLAGNQVGIYDIQFTNSPGSDGTYPSPYRGQVITTSGIVVAMDGLNGGFYLSEPQGGVWRGIYVQESAREVRVGDYISIVGEVCEHFGYTLLRNITRLEMKTSGNLLPTPSLVTTNELSVSEAYEGVLVQVTNVTVGNFDVSNDVRYVTDGSGNCGVNNSLLSSNEYKNVFITNEVYSRIIGLVDYRYGNYRLNPRNLEDFYRSPVGAGKPSWGRIKFLYR